MTIIDLHGVKHNEVKTILDDFFWSNIKMKNTYIEVITGNSDKMKSIVFDLVSEYGFVAENSIINSGIIKVSLI